MSFSDEQVMLTLAALTYRGFQDILPGALHEEVVRQALLDGLNTFEPVKNEWDLVWGPSTTRDLPLKTLHTPSVFDWNAMYVVRHRNQRNKYVIAIRGTNPIAAQDWLFGDIWVSSRVQWPYGAGKELISSSTALGLASLQSMHASRPSPIKDFTSSVGKKAADAFHSIVQSGEKLFEGLAGKIHAHKPSRVEQQITNVINHWIETIADSSALRAELQRLNAATMIDSRELRPTLTPESQRKGELDILTFLRTQTDNSADALEVTVTGHSKGGALAPTFALWLKEALRAGDNECWDSQRRARVRCFAFAGPTPGNADFAMRLDEILGDDGHYLVNANDIVPQAFQINKLQRIPSLYGSRTAALEPLVQILVKDLGQLGYQHGNRGIKEFSGELADERPFAAELIHQHLDAYLVQAEIYSSQLNAFTCFI